MEFYLKISQNQPIILQKPLLLRNNLIPNKNKMIQLILKLKKSLKVQSLMISLFQRIANVLTFGTLSLIYSVLLQVYIMQT